MLYYYTILCYRGRGWKSCWGALKHRLLRAKIFFVFFAFFFALALDKG